MDLKDIPKIFQGFKNLMFKNEAIESVAEEKLKRCFDCPIRDQFVCSSRNTARVVKDFTYGSEKRKKDQIVNGCGCELRLKVRSTSQCPIGKF